MKLGARMLNDVSGVNSFEYAETHEMTSGEQTDVYFQLQDNTKNQANSYFYPAGLRYMPATGATLQCTLQSINDDRTVTRYATQPWPTQDPSIWKLSLLTTDDVRGTVAMQLLLTEGGTVRRGTVQRAIQADTGSGAYC